MGERLAQADRVLSERIVATGDRLQTAYHSPFGYRPEAFALGALQIARGAVRFTQASMTKISEVVLPEPVWQGPNHEPTERELHDRYNAFQYDTDINNTVKPEGK